MSSNDASPAAGAQSVAILLNGERRPVAAGLSVGALLRGLGLRAGMVVVERNREILPRDGLDAVPVEDGDQIEIVHFVGGG